MTPLTLPIPTNNWPKNDIYTFRDCPSNFPGRWHDMCVDEIGDPSCERRRRTGGCPRGYA